MESDALAVGDKAWRGMPHQVLGAQGVKDTCREALEERRTSASLASKKSKRRLRKDGHKNEQETPGTMEIGRQAPLLAPGCL